MRLVDKAAASQSSSPRSEPWGSQKIERLKAREAREAQQAARLAHERSLLSEVDQVVAANFTMPEGMAARTEVAHDLLVTSSGRRRKYREVAAIMGVTIASVKNYLHPAMYERAKGKRRNGRPTAVDIRKAAARVPQDVAIEAVESKENFGARLTRRRRACGLSKSELARRMEVSVEQVTDWEQTKSRPSAGVYLKLMEVLD